MTATAINKSQEKFLKIGNIPADRNPEIPNPYYGNRTEDGRTGRRDKRVDDRRRTNDDEDTVLDAFEVGELWNFLLLTFDKYCYFVRVGDVWSILVVR